MKVLITGGNGMVAKATNKYCREIGDSVISLTRQELDISKIEAVREVFSKEQPEILINCAAYTDVDGSENNQEICYSANAYGVENLASICREFKTIFVTISTDYVFDGTKEGFYTEEDTPNPQGVYAKAKFLGEQLARKANPDSIIVRAGWIYGDFGTNFLSVVHKLLADKTIKAIDDSFGTPTFAGDLAKRLRQLADFNKADIYHLTNSGEGTSYFGFAQEVAKIKGFDLRRIERVSDKDLKRPAPRPQNSRLASVKTNISQPLQDWKSALTEFLHDK